MYVLHVGYIPVQSFIFTHPPEDVKQKKKSVGSLLALSFMYNYKLPLLARAFCFVWRILYECYGDCRHFFLATCFLCYVSGFCSYRINAIFFFFCDDELEHVKVRV